MTNAVTTSSFNPIIMGKMVSVPPGHTCANGRVREQRRSKASRGELGDLVCPGPVSKQAGKGTPPPLPRAAESPQPESPKFWWELTLVECLPYTRRCFKCLINIQTQVHLHPSLEWRRHRHSPVLEMLVQSWGTPLQEPECSPWSISGRVAVSTNHTASYVLPASSSPPTSPSATLETPLHVKTYATNIHKAPGSIQDFSDA